MKDEQTKISMVTAYDFPSAKQAEQARIDMILVGDSLGKIKMMFLMKLKKR